MQLKGKDSTVTARESVQDWDCVIPPCRVILFNFSRTRFWRRTGDPGPVALDSILKWQIKPKVKEAGFEWHGWHAFRRGLATNLYQLGVPDKTIQAILRHSNLLTTMNSYVKSVPADAIAAMRSLEEICTQYAPQLA